MKVRLENVRISYTQALFTSQQVNGQGDPKFSSAFILGRDHPALPALQEAVIAVAKEKWPTKWEEVLKTLKAADKLPVHDGDAKDSDGYKGNLFINASNKLKPLVVDINADASGNPAVLTAADGRPYSGCFVNAMIEIWAQDNQFGKRINASLLGVQFLMDGPRLAGGSVASASDFKAAVPTGAPKTDAASLF